MREEHCSHPYVYIIWCEFKFILIVNCFYSVCASCSSAPLWLYFIRVKFFKYWIIMKFASINLFFSVTGAKKWKFHTRFPFLSYILLLYFRRFSHTPNKPIGSLQMFNWLLIFACKMPSNHLYKCKFVETRDNVDYKIWMAIAAGTLKPYNVQPFIQRDESKNDFTFMFFLFIIDYDLFFTLSIGAFSSIEAFLKNE